MAGKNNILANTAGYVDHTSVDSRESEIQLILDNEMLGCVENTHIIETQTSHFPFGISQGSCLPQTTYDKLSIAHKPSQSKR